MSQENEFKLELQLFGEDILEEDEDDDFLDEIEDDEDVEGDEKATETEEVEEKIDDVRRYTDEEVDEILARKIARKEAKIRREYEDKIAKLERTTNVLTTGLGTDTLDEALDELDNYYTEKGITIPQTSKPGYTEKEERILGLSEANEIIAAGLDDVIEEVDRLAAIGNDKRSLREQAMFIKLAEHRTQEEHFKNYKKLGVSDEVLSDQSFKEFSQKFNSDVSPTEVWDLYQIKQGKQEKKRDVIGSMTTPPTTKIKDYYTSEEVDKLTMEDLDDPQIMDAVTRSMAKWK